MAASLLNWPDGYSPYGFLPSPEACEYMQTGEKVSFFFVCAQNHLQLGSQMPKVV